MGREDLIHVKLRTHLKELKFRLVAGQFPNGSDDELQILTIRVSGETPRLHHLNSFVPDLVALSEKNKLILFIEIKPKRSASDEKKLLTLLSKYKNETLKALAEHPFFSKSHKTLGKDLQNFNFFAGISFYCETLNKDLNPEIFYFLYSNELDRFQIKYRKENANGF